MASVDERQSGAWLVVDREVCEPEPTELSQAQVELGSRDKEVNVAVCLVETTIEECGFRDAPENEGRRIELRELSEQRQVVRHHTTLRHPLTSPDSSDIPAHVRRHRTRRDGPADKQRRRNSYGYLQDKAREAAELFTENPKGIRVDLRLYVYAREHANQVVVRSATGTDHVEIRIDRPSAPRNTHPPPLR